MHIYEINAYYLSRPAAQVAAPLLGGIFTIKQQVNTNALPRWAPVFRQHTILIYQQIYQIAPVFRRRHQFSGIKSPAYTFTRLEITGPVSTQTSAAANTLIGIIKQHPCSLQRSCSTQSPARHSYICWRCSGIG